jgi:hypothetical protein
MTDHRISAMLDSRTLASLRVQFQAVAEKLTGEPLALVNAYLAQGAPLPLPKDVLSALADAGCDMQEARYLLSEIEALTTRADHPHRRKRGDNDD